MFRKALVAALLVILPGPASAQSAAPDFGDYQSLLDQYVFRIAEKDQPRDTRFDYEQLYVDQKIWTTHRSERLAQLHAQLLGEKPSAMSPANRLAWGINTYNFLVIERATLNLLVPGKRFMRYKRMDEVLTPEGGFYDSRAAAVEGRDYSLDRFRRRFVYGDTSSSGGPRAPLADPRVLFATNPGCMGGPPIQPRAFRADSLDRQLDEAVRTALALPRFVTVRTSPAQLLVSDWLGRNLADFGGSTPRLLAFVEKYAPRAIRDGIRKGGLSSVSAYMQVDPLLNQKAHPKVIIQPTQGTDPGAQ